VAAQTAARLPVGPSDRLADTALTVFLMTMGPGKQVWERFGHNAIWIHDPASGTDQAYNYGLFDFHQQNFLLRFARGQMWYWMEGFPAESYAQLYIRDNRSVWIQELALPPEARLELKRFLEWNERPENRFYHYDYYRDNCSTRVRDAIDRVIGGRLKAATESLPTGTTYRFHTQRLTANDPVIFTALLVALGQPVDRPINAWQEMFLPLKLREHLRRVIIPGPGGAPIPLVKSERTLFLSTAPDPPETPPSWIGGYLALGVAIGVGAAGLAVAARRSGMARWLLAVLIGGWTVLIGLAGVVLAGLWGLTDHVMTAHNENLLQASPVALLIGLLLPGAFRSRPRAEKLARLTALVVLLLSVAGALAKLLPGFYQVNGPVIALALPAHAGVAAALWTRTRYDPLTRRKPSRASS
jgi:hypothetical protein